MVRTANSNDMCSLSNIFPSWNQNSRWRTLLILCQEIIPVESCKARQKSKLPLDFLPWIYAFPRSCHVGLYKSSKSSCHRSGSRYRIRSSTVLNPATALFNTSKGKADGGSKDGLGASVWCCNQSQEKSTSQRVNGSALTKCCTLPTYIAGKVYKWIACFQSTVYLKRQMTRVKKYLIIL